MQQRHEGLLSWQPHCQGQVTGMDSVSNGLPHSASVVTRPYDGRNEEELTQFSTGVGRYCDLRAVLLKSKWLDLFRAIKKLWYDAVISTLFMMQMVGLIAKLIHLCVLFRGVRESSTPRAKSTKGLCCLHVYINTSNPQSTCYNWNVHEMQAICPATHIVSRVYLINRAPFGYMRSSERGKIMWSRTTTSSGVSPEW